MDDAVARDRIMAVATRLFAALGYDATDLRLIADAVGMTSAEITALVGGKRELYLGMMERAFEGEQSTLQEVIDTTASPRAALHGIVDRYLDYHLAHPETHAVWMHRWGADALDIGDLEDRYPRVLLRMCASKIHGALPPNVNPYWVLATMIWSVYGFISSGILAGDHGMTGADDPAAVASFRAHMHQLMDRMMSPAEISGSG